MDFAIGQLVVYVACQLNADVERPAEDGRSAVWGGRLSSRYLRLHPLRQRVSML